MNIIDHSTSANSHNFLDQELLGATIADRYELTELLARGGMGRIYRGRQTRLNRDVVLKVLPAIQGMDDDASQKRFLREASISSQLQHPNTVTIFDYGEIALRGLKVFYIAMEYIDGVSLSEVLKKQQRLDLDQALWVIWEVSRALREAHGLGVIHRDLKPSNIMLLNTKEGESLKVLDFGIVKLLTEDAEGLTMNNRIVGSPRYMAPEQVLTNSADTRTDIYSLGVMLYQLVSGKLPFNTGSTTQIMMAHIRDPVPSIKVHSGVSVPSDVEAFINRCLDKEPDKRFQDIDALCQGMRELSWGSGMGSSETSSFTLQPVILQAARELREARRLSRELSDEVIKPVSLTETITPAPTTKPAAAVAPPPPAEERDDRKPVLFAVIGGLMVALVLLGAQWLFNQPGDSEPEPAALTVMQPSLEPPVVVEKPTPPEPEPEPEPEPAPQQISLMLASTPDGATVKENGNELGTTPLTLAFDPSVSESRKFSLEKAGYRSASVEWDPSNPEALPVGQLEKIPTARPARSRPKPAPKPDPEPELDILMER